MKLESDQIIENTVKKCTKKSKFIPLDTNDKYWTNLVQTPNFLISGNVYTLLNNLKNQIQEEGQYLLRHDAKTGPYVKVVKSSGEAGLRAYDLHSKYMTVHPGQDLKLKPGFRPLDVKTITPLHIFHGRVPGLFAPSTEQHKSPERGRGHGGRRGRGGGRGRGRGNRRGK